MKDPCKSCIEHDFCQGELPCKKRLSFLRWKERAAAIWKSRTSQHDTGSLHATHKTKKN